jgi:alpha-tubulin suppressor-like RCC1 family protein
VGTNEIIYPFYYMTPKPVSTVSGIIAIAAGGSHSLALDSGGKVWTWGANIYGQLGDTRGNSPVPAFNNVSGVRKIAAGGSHSVALRNDGTVRTWGYNHFGQLGNGFISDSVTPVQTVVTAGGAPLANVIDISAGLDHTVALLANGTVWAWGYNGIGQLGNTLLKVSSTAYLATPVQVKNQALQPLTDVKQIVAFGHHTIAVKNDGTVWAWGNNIYGQLGITTLLTPYTYSGVAIQVPLTGISLY